MVHRGLNMEPHHIDIHETTQYLKGVPHHKYAALRAEAPVSFQAEPGGPGYWAVMKHEDVVYASKRPKIFSSARGGINIPDQEEEETARCGGGRCSGRAGGGKGGGGGDGHSGRGRGCV